MLVNEPALSHEVTQSFATFVGEQKAWCGAFFFSFFELLQKCKLKFSVCNYEVDENTETLVELQLCVPWGSAPPLKIQGSLDAPVVLSRITVVIGHLTQ